MPQWAPERREVSVVCILDAPVHGRYDQVWSNVDLKAKTSLGVSGIFSFWMKRTFLQYLFLYGEFFEQLQGASNKGGILKYLTFWFIPLVLWSSKKNNLMFHKIEFIRVILSIFDIEMTLYTMRADIVSLAFSPRLLISVCWIVPSQSHRSHKVIYLPYLHYVFSFWSQV